MEETSKSKKTLKTLGIVIIALVVIFIALVAALGTGDSETAKNMTPERRIWRLRGRSGPPSSTR